MKTILIVVGLVCTDYMQEIYCYKAVVKRTEKEVRRMKPLERACDTFTIFTSRPLVPGSEVASTY
jgi:hypothetical protein